MNVQKTKSNFGRKGWGMIIYILILYMLTAAVVDTLNISVGAFAEMKQWESNSLLAFSTIGGWIGVIGTLIFGQWVAKKGVKTPTVIGLFLLGAFFIFNGQVNSIPMYALAIILLSIMSNCINLVATNTFMSNWFPTKKGIALGWATMGMPISSAAMVPIFAGILGATGSISAPYLFFGILTFLVAIATIFFVKSNPEEAGAYPDNEPITAEQAKANLDMMNAHKSEWTIPKLLACKQMWLVSIVFGLLFISIVATMTQFVPRFIAAGFTQGEAILWLSVASVLGIPGSYAWGFIDQKIGTKGTTIIYGVYMAVLQFLSAIFFDSKAISIVLVILLGILIGGIGNLFPSMVIQVFGRFDFAAANRIIVPLVVAFRTSAFIIMVAVLTSFHGSFKALLVVLGIVSILAIIATLMLSNKQIGTQNAEKIDALKAEA